MFSSECGGWGGDGEGHQTRLKEKDGVETDYYYYYRGERTEDHIESFKDGWLKRVLSHLDFIEFLRTKTALFYIFSGTLFVRNHNISLVSTCIRISGPCFAIVWTQK